MALITTERDPYRTDDLSAAYVWILGIHLDYQNESASWTVGIFASKSARNGGGRPLETLDYRLGPTARPEHTDERGNVTQEALPAFSSVFGSELSTDPREPAYNLLKTLSRFSSASDDREIGGTNPGGGGGRG